MITLQEAEAKAVEIAERAASLPPEEGLALMLEETRSFPAPLRELIIMLAAKAAEHTRIEAVRREAAMNEKDRDVHRMMEVSGFWIGAATTFLILLLVVFVTPHPTPEQWFIERLFGSLVGGGGFSVSLTGFLKVDARWKQVTIVATGPLAVFVLSFFWNPSPLPH